MSNIIADSAYRQAFHIYKIMAHPVAIHILNTISTTPGGECSSEMLCSKKLHISTIYIHLRALLQVNVIRREIYNKETHYKLAHGRIETINASAARLL